MDAASGAAAVWWSLGIAVLLLVVTPTLLFLAHRVLRRLIEISRYAEDILDNGVRVAGNLDPVPALAETQTLVRSAVGRLHAYAAAQGGQR